MILSTVMNQTNNYGIGGNLHLFTDNGTLLQIYNIFPSQRIYGIVSNHRNNLAIYGSNKIKIIEFDFVNSKITKQLITKNCEDWILDIKWINRIDHQNIVTVFANNYIKLWSNDMMELKKTACEERCLLYSASIVNNTWKDLFICSGTVFSEILIWKPSESPYFCSVLCRLVGHDGVIFSINYNKQLNLIITTSDDRTVRFWNSDVFEKKLKKVSPIRTIYGHLARVFKSLIVDNSIVSVGEDSIIYVWNIEGELIRKFDAHQNGGVWCIDKTKDGRLVSGGGDAGISIYPFKINSEIKDLTLEKGEIPKVLKILSSTNIVVITESGTLKYYDKKLEKWKDVCKHEELKSYCVMDVSESRNLLALGGFRGEIYIYDDSNNFKLQSTNTSTNNSRIFSIHWLNESMLLTSENDGKLQIWNIDVINDYILEPKEELLLPPSKERWATSAVLSNNLLIVGDRKGNIHLYKFNETNPIQTIKKAHNHLGITNLYNDQTILLSTGRNRILKKFNYDPEKNLTQIMQDKLPFMWICRVCTYKNTTIILGFSGSNFIIWDHDNRRVLHEINCGGGHRSWDFHLDDSDNINFIYIKEKVIQNFLCKWNYIATTNIIEGFHTKEINMVRMLQINDKLLIISGGEDTTIRVGTVDLKNTIYKNINVLKSHLSSVRCLKLFQLHPNEYLMISAGGRAQIIVWNIKINQDGKLIDIIETDNYYKDLDSSESETRIMDLTILKDSYLLITACSDGTLRLYKIDPDNLKLEYQRTITYALKCIMKVQEIFVDNRNLIVSMATDGIITFWDMDLKPFYSLPANQSGINSFCYKNLKDNLYLFITGGDDNALVINLLEIDFDNTFNIKLINTYRNTKCHGAQITGVDIFDDLIITTSIDQNVSIFQYSFNEKFCCNLIQDYSSVVADIQGMNCLRVDDKIYSCLHGIGIEIINICKNT